MPSTLAFAAPCSTSLTARAAPAAQSRRHVRRGQALVVRAQQEQSDAERAAALRASLAAAQSNPVVAAKLQEMESAMANPNTQAQMGQMM